MASPEDLNKIAPGLGGTVQKDDFGDPPFLAGEPKNAEVANPPSNGNKSRKVDYRARLQLYAKNSNLFFDSQSVNVMTPLEANRGIVFPYTPN